MEDFARPARRLVRSSSASTPSAISQVAADQLLRFAGVGVISTLGYLFLFIAWRPVVGDFGSNALALAICTLFNTAVHRELARSMPGPGTRVASWRCRPDCSPSACS